jgi:hypothetical protein
MDTGPAAINRNDIKKRSNAIRRNAVSERRR